MPEVTARGLRFHVQTLNAMQGESPAGTTATDPPVVVFIHGLVIDNLSSFYFTLAGPVAAVGAQAADRVLGEHVPDCALYMLPGHRHTVLSEGTGELLDALLPWPAWLTGAKVPAANVFEGASA
jgi:hypothetical protein